MRKKGGLPERFGVHDVVASQLENLSAAQSGHLRLHRKVIFFQHNFLDVYFTVVHALFPSKLLE